MAGALFLGGGYWLATRGDRGAANEVDGEGDAASGESPTVFDSTRTPLPAPHYTIWSPSLGDDAGLGNADLLGIARASQVTKAVGKGGLVVKRDALGAWSREDSGTTVDLFGIAMHASGAAIVVGAHGTALVEGARDRPWAATKTGTEEDLRAVAFAASSGAAFAVGAKGTVLSLPKGALAWKAETSPVPADLSGVWASDDGSLVIAVGKGGCVLRRADAGEWVLEPSGTTEDLFAVAGEDRSVRAAGAAGTVVQRNAGKGGSDAGAAWALVSPPAAEGPAATANLYGIAMHGGTIHVVGAHGATLRYGSRGWQVDQSGTERTLYAVVADASLTAAAGAGGLVMTRAQ